MADHNDANRDPISGQPGAHPIGTGAGAAGAGATGAAIGGAVGGPIGAVVGGAIGAVAGGLAGKGAAEAINPTVEDTYWRENYKTRPYAKADVAYDTYQPAYRYGWESRTQHAGRKYDEVETDLERGWDKAKGTSRLAWGEAKHAVRDAWHRVDGNPRT
jgi:phage tail tape-measure protein